VNRNASEGRLKTEDQRLSHIDSRKLTKILRKRRAAVDGVDGGDRKCSQAVTAQRAQGQLKHVAFRSD
jgi:hypothetical protein